MVSSMSLSEVVSSQGRFITANTARGAAGPEPRTPSRTQRPPCLPPPSRPPWARAGAARAAARSAPRGSFPRCSPARPQEPAPATPPRAGGAPSPASSAQAPAAPPGTASSGVSVSRDWPERRGGAALAKPRRGAPAEAWERGRASGARELSAGWERRRRAGARSRYL